MPDDEPAMIGISERANSVAFLTLAEREGQRRHREC